MGTTGSCIFDKMHMHVEQSTYEQDSELIDQMSKKGGLPCDREGEYEV